MQKSDNKITVAPSFFFFVRKDKEKHRQYYLAPMLLTIMEFHSIDMAFYCTWVARSVVVQVGVDGTRADTLTLTIVWKKIGRNRQKFNNLPKFTDP